MERDFEKFDPKAYIEKAAAEIRSQVGDGRALLALSGGVDSSVCAALMSRAIGKNFIAIFVNTGLMRKHEPEEVSAAFSGGNMDFRLVDGEERFLGKLAGVTEPEKKRKIIGEEFIRVFEEEAKKAGKVDFFVQGTIYPDVIESGLDGNRQVKAHHNVGGMPKDIDFKAIIEPLRPLYKEEVRALGRELGLPAEITERQPFPGPGLAVRCLGELTKERLDLLREVDWIFRDEVAKAGLAGKINQYFAILTSLRSTGVTEGARTYDNTVALRAVTTHDFVTADWVKLPWEVLEATGDRIAREVKGVNRVVYDITKKPPSTIEWE